MVRGILADINVDGHFHSLVKSFLFGDEWSPFWHELDLIVETFKTLGLQENTPDDLIWRLCQSQKLVLFTANRNKQGDDSLESVMLLESTLESLPVITVSDG